MLAAHTRVPFGLAPARRAVIRTSRVPSMVVRASQAGEERSLSEKLALPAAALLGAALMFAATPDAAEAARSGGRVGGSGGFAARRSAPPANQAPAVQNNYYSAPPVVGGGFGLPFFGGFGFYPSFGFGFGVPMFGGFSFLFNIMLLGIVINVIWAVVSNLSNSGSRQDKKDDEW